MAAKRNVAEPKVTFHIIRAPLHRTAHIDGAIGSVTPSGGIHLNFYSEYNALPTKSVFHADTDSVLIDEILDERAGPNGYVREIEFSAILNLDAARYLHGWLELQILAAVEKAASLAAIAAKKAKSAD